MTRWHRACIVCGLVGLLISASSSAADPAGKLKADPPSEMLAWPAELKLDIPAPSDELVFADRGGPFVQFEARTGKALPTVAINKLGRRGFPVVSPGGSFLAVATEKDMRFFDLASGGDAGTLSIPAAKRGGFCQCESLDFSAAGRL